MLNKYWYKATGTMMGCKQRMTEGGLCALTAENALSIMSIQLKQWKLTKVTCILIYDVDQYGEMSEEPVLMQEFKDGTILPTVSYDMTNTEKPKESLATHYEAATWLNKFDKPQPFNLVRMK